MGRKNEALERLAEAEKKVPESPLLEKVRSRLFADEP
jgi:hypothetical protein